MGRAACENASSQPVPEGNVGAGTGASIGKLMGTQRAMKSGLGVYAVQLGDLQVGALVTVNALGDVFDLDTGRQIGGLLSEDKNICAIQKNSCIGSIPPIKIILQGIRLSAVL